MTTTLKFTHSYECTLAMRMFLAEEIIEDPDARMTSQTLRRRFLEFCYETLLPEVIAEIPEMELWITLQRYMIANYKWIITSPKSNRSGFAGTRFIRPRRRYLHIPRDYAPVMTDDPSINVKMAPIYTQEELAAMIAESEAEEFGCEN